MTSKMYRITSVSTVSIFLALLILILAPTRAFSQEVIQYTYPKVGPAIVKLIFPERKPIDAVEADQYFNAYANNKFWQTPIDMNVFMDKLKNYNVVQVELWADVRTQEPNITNLYISSQLYAGCKIIISPRKIGE